MRQTQRVCMALLCMGHITLGCVVVAEFLPGFCTSAFVNGTAQKTFRLGMLLQMTCQSSQGQ